MSAVSSNLRNRRSAVLAAAVSASLAASAASAATTVDGSVSGGEYGSAAAIQNNATGFGNNLSELNQAFANYLPGSSLELALTGNLQDGGNGLVIFIDSKAGGGINASAGGGYNQFGSISGTRTDDWGTDTDGSAA